MSRGLVIAAPASGSGKTTVTLGLLRHLARSGVRVASAKAGPDYIDPKFHEAATGRPCGNLDLWAMRGTTIGATLGALADEADLVLVEGVMGLFDGIGPAGDRCSTADLACHLGWPVVLVVDAAAQAGSVAALVAGFHRHRADLRLSGVILNRVGGERHAAMLRGALAAALPDVPVLGSIARAPGLATPSRHLGLVPAGERPDLDAFLDRAAVLVAGSVDVEALVALAGPGGPIGVAPAPAAPLPPLGGRIAIARDAAFAFLYPALAEGWRRAGADLTFFSPLADEAPDEAADAVFLPGGYPELHAGRLAAAGAFRAGLAAAAARGAVVYGECGGYMALGSALIDAAGQAHAMAGLLPVVTSFAARRLHLGYRSARLLAPHALGVAGAGFRGHEFHYATIVEEGIVEEGGADRLFATGDAQGHDLGLAGLRRGSVAGSFIHLIDRVA